MRNKFNIVKISKYLIILMIIQISLIFVLVTNKILINFDLLPNNKFNDSTITSILTIIFIGFTLYVIFRDLHLINLMDKQANIQKETLDNVKKLNTALRSQRHDFLNHIQVVYSLIEMEEYDEVIKYLNDVYGSIELLNTFMKTEDIAVNALLRAKSFDANRKGVIYNLNISSSLHNLSIPSWELCRCLGNLIDNAIFASANYDKEKVIDIYIKENISEFKFSVINTGETIPKENMNKIFTPGFTTKKDFGEGIGLHIIKQTVQQYKGSIEVTSKDFKTNFTITIPKSVEIHQNKNDN